jgi:hypothetical protein
MNKKLFPGLLDAVMQKNGINQVQLHKLTGIAVSRVNNYLQAKLREGHRRPRGARRAGENLPARPPA